MRRVVIQPYNWTVNHRQIIKVYVRESCGLGQIPQRRETQFGHIISDLTTNHAVVSTFSGLYTVLSQLPDARY